MKKLLLSLMISALLVESCTAAVHERDLIAGSGDGLLTYDDFNQREWLDLSQTLLTQFPGAPSGASQAVDLDARYQNVVSELGPGGMFEGFNIAKREDVIALAESAGIDTNTRDFLTNGEAIENLIQLFGVTNADQSGRINTYGFVDEIGLPVQPPPSHLAAILVFVPKNHPTLVARAGLSFGVDEFAAKETTGILLYRIIPEPSSALLVMLGLAISLTSRRRLANNSGS